MYESLESNLTRAIADSHDVEQAGRLANHLLSNDGKAGLLIGLVSDGSRTLIISGC